MWTPDDQDKMLALRWVRRNEAAMAEADKAARCPDCGERYDDWLDPETKRRYEVDRRELFTMTCISCREIASANERLEGRDIAGLKLHFGPARPLDEVDDPLGSLPPAPTHDHRPPDLESLPDFG
jgi:hypothetical protein